MNPENKHLGDLTALAGKVYDFTEVTGYVDARGADTKTAFPKLTTVGGSIHAYGADTKTAFPKLTTVGGYVDARGADTKTAFPKLTTVGGYVDASGADTKTAFPKLTTVGGSIYAKGADTKTAFPKLKSQNNTDALKAPLAAQNLIRADGILANVVSKKGPVMRVIVIGRNKVSYIVQRDGRTAHGATLAEARTDLLTKSGNRDTSAYKAWKADTAASLQDMIVAYRVITGACQQGVSFFLAETKVPAKLTVGEAIELTKGRYGHETFRNFFTAA